MDRYLCSMLLVASVTGCPHNMRSSQSARDEDARTNSNLYGQKDRSLPADETAELLTPPMRRSQDEIATTGSIPDTTRPTRGTDLSAPAYGWTAPSVANETNETAQGPLTAAEQTEKEVDIKLTQDIRRALESNSSLWFSSKNVKIITRNGRVTLRGSVRTQREFQIIDESAKQVAGPGSVDNQLEIATD